MAQDLFSLTQIRHLMRVEFSRAQRYSYPLGGLVIRVDGIDKVRVGHGFEAADDVVAQVTEMLVARTRACDHVGRLVDDRLVAVLPHTNSAGAVALGERLVAAAHELDVTVAGQKLPVTVSVGSTCFEDSNTLFFDALVDAADAAFERAAEAGGDRVVHVSPAEVA